MKLNIIARYNMPERHVRAYLHGSGQEVWGSEGLSAIYTAKEHLIDAFDSSHKSFIKSHDYVLAVLWGDDGSKVIDCFCNTGVPKDPKNGPGNPEWDLWFMRNGILTREGKSCGDSVIIMGREEEYRRFCPDLKTFLKQPPRIAGLENIIDG